MPTADTTTQIVDNAYLPILPEVERKFRVRNALRQGSMSGDAVQFPDVSGGEGAPTTVAEGAVKPQMDKDFSLVTYNAQTIAGYMRLSNQMLSDFKESLLTWLTNSHVRFTTLRTLSC